MVYHRDVAKLKRDTKKSEVYDKFFMVFIFEALCFI